MADREQLAVRALLTSIGLLLVGNGLLSTAVTLRAEAEGFSGAGLGAVVAAFYVGLTVGAVGAPRFIRRVGHVRLYAGLVALCCAAALALPIAATPAGWVMLRAAMGLAFGGIFVVVESWLSGSATTENRGARLAAYMIIVQASLAFGQLVVPVFPLTESGAFLSATVIYFAAAIPLTANRRIRPPAPPPARPLPITRILRAAPAGVIGCAASGAITGSLLALGPLYVILRGHSVQRASLFMLVAIGSGLVLQWPLGRLSDRVGREPVLVGTLVSVAVVSAGTPLIANAGFPALAIIGAMVGMSAFAIYPLGVAATGDRIPAGELPAASGVLLTAFGAGSALAPLALSAAMSGAGPNALFYGISVCALGAGVFVAAGSFNRALRPAVELE